MYRDFEDKQILRNLLRECKTDEEKENLIREYQGASITAVAIGFILAIIICGTITLLF
jgi:hypothetical protein